MKSVYKFIHVFIGLIIFLYLGYTLQNLDEIIDFTRNDISKSVQKDRLKVLKTEAIENTLEVTYPEALHDKIASTLSDDTASEQDIFLEQDTTSNNSPTETKEQPKTTEAENNITETFVLDYEMEPINHHSIEHLYTMIKIIDEYKLSPHTDYKALYNDLNIKNFAHFKKELSKKNIKVHDVLSVQMSLISEIDGSENTDNLNTLLDIIKEILINLTEVK